MQAQRKHISFETISQEPQEANAQLGNVHYATPARYYARNQIGALNLDHAQHVCKQQVQGLIFAENLFAKFSKLQQVQFLITVRDTGTVLNEIEFVWQMNQEPVMAQQVLSDAALGALQGIASAMQVPAIFCVHALPWKQKIVATVTDYCEYQVANKANTLTLQLRAPQYVLEYDMNKPVKYFFINPQVYIAKDVVLTPSKSEVVPSTFEFTHNCKTFVPWRETEFTLSKFGIDWSVYEPYFALDTSKIQSFSELTYTSNNGGKITLQLVPDSHHITVNDTVYSVATLIIDCFKLKIAATNNNNRMFVDIAKAGHITMNMCSASKLNNLLLQTDMSCVKVKTIQSDNPLVNYLRIDHYECHLRGVATSKGVYTAYPSDLVQVTCIPSVDEYANSKMLFCTTGAHASFSYEPQEQALYFHELSFVHFKSYIQCLIPNKYVKLGNHGQVFENTAVAQLSVNDVLVWLRKEVPRAGNIAWQTMQLKTMVFDGNTFIEFMGFVPKQGTINLKYNVWSNELVVKCGKQVYVAVNYITMKKIAMYCDIKILFK